jgi:predicted nucleic acid-binding protein
MLLVDTGVFVAAADADEPSHAACAEILRSTRGLAVAAPVIPEAAWLIEARLGPEAETRLLRLVTSDHFTIVDLTPADYDRSIELITAYASLGLGFVDASIVTVAERLTERAIATLNRRDFAVVRPRHCDAFTLVP